MRARPVAACLLLLVPLFAPSAAAQSLSQRLGDLRFPEIVVMVAPKLIEVQANRASLAGSTASDLRKCVDGANCPDSTLAQASQGDGNGQVDAGEVDAFQRGILIGLNLAGGDLAEFRQLIRELVSIDGQGAASVRFVELRFENAVGPISSTSPVAVYVRLHGEFPNVADGDRHAVSLLREESGLQIADRVVIRPGKGWRVDRDSIQPPALRSFFGDGEIAGSQSQLEGPEPLTFDLEKKGPGAMTLLLLALSALLVAGAVAAFVIARRRRRKG